MSNRISKSILAASLAAAASVAVADDELIVYATQDGEAFKGATIILDGTVEENVPRSGIVKFDLDGGTHTIEVLDVFSKVHEFRFDSVEGQLVDAAVAINAGQAKHFVEAFSRVESAADRRNAPKGTLTGKVNLAGADVTGATVTVEKTGDSVTVDASGEYEFTLPRGEYDLVVNHPEASKPQTLTTRIVSNITRGKNFYLSSAASAAAAPALANPLDAVPEGLIGDVEEVMVTATFNPNAFGETEQFSSSVVNTLNFEDLARFSAGDVAAAVVKAPGVTVQDGKNIFIRGLGGRYITATLNGATMPSTDPNKRTVPLDLFPTNMVDQLDIQKTFAATMPGESSGGNLTINTRSFPDERAGSFSFSTGGNSWVTNHDVKVDPISGDYDYLGWDDGARKEPGLARAVGILQADYSDYVSDDVMLELRKQAGAEILHGLDYGTEKANPDVSIGANIGDLFYVGDNELGVFAAANYSNSWSRQDRAVRNTYGDDGTAQNTYDRDKVQNNIETSALVSLGLNIGESTLESVSIVSRATESYVDFREGFNQESGFDSTEWTIQWEERQFVAQQFLGEHILWDVLAKWQVTATQSTRWAPDRREIRFDARDNNDFGAYTFEAGNMIRRFDDLVDNNLDISFDLEYDTDFTSFWSATLYGGAKSIRQDRDAESRSYGFDFNGSLRESRDGVALSTDLLVENVLNEETNGVEPGFIFREKTQASDTYDAELALDAAYLSLDSTIANDFQVVLGARVEDFFMETNTVDPRSGLEGTAILDEQLVLPSLSLNWMFNEAMQLRLVGTKTASRPDFKERSNAVWFDEENNRYRGNPFLLSSKVDNLDARFEWYFGEDDEKLTAAYFYKNIEDAIEEVQQPVSGSTPATVTFQNADKANIEGIEIDFKKNFGLPGFSDQDMFVQGNVAFIDSVAEVTDQPSRTLQGQPEYTANLILGWDDLARDQKMTLLFNQNGEAIRFVGDAAQPDEVLLGRLVADLNYSKNIGDITVGAEVTNIFDENLTVVQRFDTDAGEVERVTRRFRTGIGFGANIKWNF